jgi:hypothetical protein
MVSVRGIIKKILLAVSVALTFTAMAVMGTYAVKKQPKPLVRKYTGNRHKLLEAAKVMLILIMVLVITVVWYSY